MFVVGSVVIGGVFVVCGVGAVLVVAVLVVVGGEFVFVVGGGGSA